ncbi:MAG TPA: NFACT RNA binding domain-containing protein [Vulgatibacter sp.]|nr:NFACT RNA binding domain-containing protein [Vulgatibacter sp.]
MSLSASELAAVVAELQPLVGGTVQKIRVPSPRVAILELRIPGATLELLLGAEPDETRIHLATERPPSPRTPLHLQNLLRAHLLPSRLAGLRQIPGERIVRLDFETPAGRRALVAELTGRHGNLILLREDDVVMGLAVPSSSTTRPLLPGHPYAPPPPRERAAPERQPFEVGRGPYPISAAIEARYGPLARQRALAERRREALRGVAAARKRIGTALQRIQGERARAKDAGTWRRWADLLAPLASRIPRGATSIRATEYTEAGTVEVEVPLRPELTGRENLERYYKEYRRMRAAEERIAAREAELGQREARLAALASRLAAAQTEGEIDELAREAAAVGAGPRIQRRAAKGEAARPPYRTYVSATRRSIWVGRGARENDSLTFRVAKGNDLWLHARGVAGAHVVVPASPGSPPDEPTLLDACALAAHFSGAKGEAVAEIAQTRVRHVRKPKGSAPGAVVFTQDRSIPYRHEEDRIARLLAQQPG